MPPLGPAEARAVARLAGAVIDVDRYGWFYEPEAASPRRTAAHRAAVRKAAARSLAALLGAAALWVAVPEPALARERSGTLDRQTMIRDRHGFRSGRIDTDPTDGTSVIRNRQGFVTERHQKTPGGDTILRDATGRAVGHTEGPR